MASAGAATRRRWRARKRADHRPGYSAAASAYDCQAGGEIPSRDLAREFLWTRFSTVRAMCDWNTALDASE